MAYGPVITTADRNGRGPGYPDAGVPITRPLPGLRRRGVNHLGPARASALESGLLDQRAAAPRVAKPMAAATAARIATLVSAVGRENQSAMNPMAGGPSSMPP